MSKTIQLKDGTFIKSNAYDAFSITENVLAPKFGKMMTSFTVEQIKATEAFMNDGWEICDVYWGRER